MGEMTDSFVDFINRLFGPRATPADARGAMNTPWVARGVSDAAKRLGDIDTERAAVWAFAFGSGAKRALHDARVILSDPIIKGRELDALALIDQGLSHGEIIAAMGGRDRSVVPFSTKR